MVDSSRFSRARVHGLLASSTSISASRHCKMVVKVPGQFCIVHKQHLYKFNTRLHNKRGRLKEHTLAREVEKAIQIILEAPVVPRYIKTLHLQIKIVSMSWTRSESIMALISEESKNNLNLTLGSMYTLFIKVLEVAGAKPGPLCSKTQFKAPITSLLEAWVLSRPSTGTVRESSSKARTRDQKACETADIAVSNQFTSIEHVQTCTYDTNTHTQTNTSDDTDLVLTGASATNKHILTNLSVHSKDIYTNKPPSKSQNLSTISSYVEQVLSIPSPNKEQVLMGEFAGNGQIPTSDPSINIQAPTSFSVDNDQALAYSSADNDQIFTSDTFGGNQLLEGDFAGKNKFCTSNCDYNDPVLTTNFASDNQVLTSDSACNDNVLTSDSAGNNQVTMQYFASNEQIQTRTPSSNGIALMRASPNKKLYPMRLYPNKEHSMRPSPNKEPSVRPSLNKEQFMRPFPNKKHFNYQVVAIASTSNEKIQTRTSNNNGIALMRASPNRKLIPVRPSPNKEQSLRLSPNKGQSMRPSPNKELSMRPSPNKELSMRPSPNQEHSMRPPNKEHHSMRLSPDKDQINDQILTIASACSEQIQTGISYSNGKALIRASPNKKIISTMPPPNIDQFARASFNKEESCPSTSCHTNEISCSSSCHHCLTAISTNGSGIRDDFRKGALNQESANVNLLKGVVCKSDDGRSCESTDCHSKNPNYDSGLTISESTTLQVTWGEALCSGETNLATVEPLKLGAQAGSRILFHKENSAVGNVDFTRLLNSPRSETMVHDSALPNNTSPTEEITDEDMAVTQQDAKPSHFARKHITRNFNTLPDLVKFFRGLSASDQNMTLQAMYHAFPCMKGVAFDPNIKFPWEESTLNPQPDLSFDSSNKESFDSSNKESFDSSNKESFDSSNKESFDSSNKESFDSSSKEPPLPSIDPSKIRNPLPSKCPRKQMNRLRKKRRSYDYLFNVVDLLEDEQSFMKLPTRHPTRSTRGQLLDTTKLLSDLKWGPMFR